MALDAWLTVLQAARSRRAVWRELLKQSGSAEALARESARALAAAGLDDEEIRKLKAPDPIALERAKAWLRGDDRELVTFDSERYPPLLAETSDAPLALWTQGRERELLSTPQLAMVGSRNPTASGRETAEQFARYLSERGLTITSGLAIGIDGACHRGALEGVGGTVAVLGSGIDVIYPREHEGLAAEVAAKGLLVSEYPPGTSSLPFHFPQRNRIIAGLALGTLVVEATRRSGSLITATRALEYGREVFAIPGSIHNPLARGCHALIRQGAKLVEEAVDIFVELAPQLPVDRIEKIAPRESAPQSVFLDRPEYASLLEKIDFAPTSIADLMQRVGLTAPEVSSMLLVLELEGCVEALPGGRYARLAKRTS